MSKTIELARQAGLETRYGHVFKATPDTLERFAALIRAQEREQIAMHFQNEPAISSQYRFVCLIAAAIRGMKDE